jgi:hypothetical protein
MKSGFSKKFFFFNKLFIRIFKKSTTLLEKIGLKEFFENKTKNIKIKPHAPPKKFCVILL